MVARKDLAAALAHALLDGAWEEDALRARLATTTRPRLRRPKIAALVKWVLAHFARPPSDDPDALARVLSAWPRLPAAESLRIARWHTPTLAPAPSRFDAPILEDAAALATLLDVAHLPQSLIALADPAHLSDHASVDAVRHYHVRFVPKRSGGVRPIEAPKDALKRAQRRILHAILARAPLHDAARGFRRGLGPRDHARAHVGKEVVLRFDLRDFFLGITAPRVRGVFRMLGYPAPIARLLTGLTTRAGARRDVDAARAALRERKVVESEVFGFVRALRAPHLPQGAPTSPMLANLVAYKLDVRLSALAASAGGAYTRYADDLALSGPPSLRGIAPIVARIVEEEGFALQPHKSRCMERHTRQMIAGVVVNERINVSRRERDLLRAILFNAGRAGGAAQNRAGHADFRAHLRGRIEHVAHLRGDLRASLLEAFAKIDWSETAP